MSKRVTLTNTEIAFILDHTEQQLRHAATDPHRGVFAEEGLLRLQAKLKIKPSISKVSASSTDTSIPSNSKQSMHQAPTT